MLPRLIVFSLLFLGFLSVMPAQSAALVAFHPVDKAVLNATEPERTSWSLYSDAENNRYYIDFQQLPVNVKDIVVKRPDGAVVLEDHVFTLPVDTIYELDFSNYRPGTYSIELQSFSGVLRKEVVVR